MSNKAKRTNYKAKQNRTHRMGERSSCEQQKAEVSKGKESNLKLSLHPAFGSFEV